MSEHVYNLYEAKTDLSKLVDRAAKGEEIIIAKAGHGMAKLVPLRGGRRRRRPGGSKGDIFIADDFDAPLPEEIENAFAGRSE